MKASQVVKVALERIALAEQRLVAFQYALKGIKTENAEIRLACHVLYSALAGNINEAYQNLFMWGNLFDEAQKEAREKAMRQYLSDGHAIMGYLEIDGASPNMWSGELEKEFRELIAEVEKEEDDG